MQMATIGLGNPEVKILIDKSQESKGQTKDSSREKHLSELHNNNSDSEIELV